jgi:hypothetical protein
MSAILHTIITSIEDDRHKNHLQSWKKNMKKDKEKKLQEKKNTIDKLVRNRGKLHKKILNICKSTLKEIRIPKSLKTEDMNYYMDGCEFPFIKWKYDRSLGIPYYYDLYNDNNWYKFDRLFSDYDYTIVEGGCYKKFVEEFLTEIENWLIELDEESMKLSLFKIDNLNDIRMSFQINYQWNYGTECETSGSLI